MDIITNISAIQKQGKTLVLRVKGGNKKGGIILVQKMGGGKDPVAASKVATLSHFHTTMNASSD